MGKTYEILDESIQRMDETIIKATSCRTTELFIFSP